MAQTLLARSAVWLTSSMMRATVSLGSLSSVPLKGFVLQPPLPLVGPPRHGGGFGRKQKDLVRMRASACSQQPQHAVGEVSMLPLRLGQLPHGREASEVLVASSSRPAHEALMTSRSVWHTTSCPPSVVAEGLSQLAQVCRVRILRAMLPGSRMHWPSGRLGFGVGVGVGETGASVYLHPAGQDDAFRGSSASSKTVAQSSPGFVDVALAVPVHVAMSGEGGCEGEGTVQTATVSRSTAVTPGIPSISPAAAGEHLELGQNLAKSLSRTVRQAAGVSKATVKLTITLPACTTISTSATSISAASVRFCL